MTERQKQLLRDSGLPMALRIKAHEILGLPRLQKAGDFWNLYDRLAGTDWTKPQPFTIVQGPNNTGKTVLLACLGRHAAAHDVPVHYIEELVFITRLKRSWNSGGPEYEFPLPPWHPKRSSIIMWDELALHDYAAERTAWDAFNGAVDRLLERNMNCIFATNYPLTAVGRRVGKRFSARLDRRGEPRVFTLKRILV